MQRARPASIRGAAAEVARPRRGIGSGRSREQAIEGADQLARRHAAPPLLHDAALRVEQEEVGVVESLYEPDQETLLKSLLPRHIGVQVWQALLESFAAEQASRMVAMENATENASELIRGLTLEYNKARQAAITTEILEIVGGAEALKNG